MKLHRNNDLKFKKRTLIIWQIISISMKYLYTHTHMYILYNMYVYIFSCMHA